MRCGARQEQPEPQECGLELGARAQCLRPQRELLSQPARGLTGLNSLPSFRLMPEGQHYSPPPWPGPLLAGSQVWLRLDGVPFLSPSDLRPPVHSPWSDRPPPPVLHTHVPQLPGNPFPENPLPSPVSPHLASEPSQKSSL